MLKLCMLRLPLLPLKLSLSLSTHEPMLSLSMLVLDPNHPDYHPATNLTTVSL